MMSTIELKKVQPMEIKLLTPDIKEAWDSFAMNTEGGTCYHLSNWKAVFEQTYRYQT